MKVATWNIAGNQTYPDKLENPEYFVKIIDEINPDILLLQEVHFKDNYSFSQKYFSNYKYIFNSPISDSHNNPQFKLGLSILSKFEIINPETFLLINPDLTKVQTDGKIIKSHDKAVQVCNINGINVANTQLLPLHVFNTNYEKETIFTQQLEGQLLSILKTPLIFAGDFNHPVPQDLFPGLFNKLAVKDCLSGEPTFIYKNSNPDHIFISKDMKVSNSKIQKTKTDHYLCIVKIGV